MSIDWFSFFVGFYVACSIGWTIFWIFEVGLSCKEKLIMCALWIVAWPLILTVAIAVNVEEAIRKKRNGRA